MSTLYRILNLGLAVAFLTIAVACSGQMTQSTIPSQTTASQTPTSPSSTETASDPANSKPPAKKKPPAKPVPPQGENQVLRHAVFFKFKESSTKEDVQGVVDAFRNLPSKIEEITDFEWGENNSPETHDDGFTHCFLLAFADVEGRKVYLPHPEHGKFGDVLRPHMADVFVIDYWGTPAEDPPAKQLRHAVFLKFKDDATPEDIKKIEEEFAKLPAKIDAIKSFEWGVNHSPETHDDGFTHAFLITFDSEDGRAAYLPHPAHQAFVKVLTPVLDKVRVLDYWAAE